MLNGDDVSYVNRYTGVSYVSGTPLCTLHSHFAAPVQFCFAASVLTCICHFLFYSFVRNVKGAIAIADASNHGKCFILYMQVDIWYFKA